MRHARPLLIALALASLAMPASAQGTTSTPYDVSWATLDPGDDFAAQVVRSIFPVPGIAGGTSTGQEASVIQLIVGQFTGFIAAIACAFVAYNVIMQIHRAAESSRILGSGQSWMFVVRVGFAATMMFPIGGGFSAGQGLVMRAALLGVGMAKVVYVNAIKAVGPDAMTIAQPMIPGTKRIVAGLIDSELCKDLVNLATNTAERMPLIPTPNPMPSTAPDGNGYISWQYQMSDGNNIGTPTCGTVTIRQSTAQVQTIAGLDLDMSAVQKSVLYDVLSGGIQQQVAKVAQNLWQTKQAASLVPLQSIFVNATDNYTSLLTSEATSIQSTINQHLAANAAQYRQGADRMQNFVQQSQLGFSGAGAYYLEIAKMNATTLSLLQNAPEVTPPTYDGLGPALSYDLAPLEAAQTDFMTKLSYTVQTTDTASVTCGAPQMAGRDKEGDEGTLSKVLCGMHISDGVMTGIANWLLPSTEIWTDPFGGLMGLGQKLINTSLIAMGAAALMSSGLVAGGSALFSFFTANWTAAAAAIASNVIMSFLGTPIFFGLLAILIPGITIAYVLPMIPWVMWMAGVAGWIILVCEAMIAVPLWMLAHMTFGGDGLHGRGGEGWSMLFSVVFRPTMMLIGLFLGYFVFDCMSWLIRESFGVATGFVLDHGWIVSNFIGLTVLLSIFVSTHVVAALMSFRLVAQLPHHLPRMIGFTSGNRVDGEDFVRRGALGPGASAAIETRRGLASGQTQIAANMRSLRGGSTKFIGASGKDEASAASGGMDSTLRATTDRASKGEES